MSLLARDHRLPHLFGLRAERPVYRYGVVALALLATLLLLATDADTHRLLPLFAIGVFIGFTLSRLGLVRHWATQRPPGWKRRALINGTGALLGATRSSRTSAVCSSPPSCGPAPTSWSACSRTA
jgi:hypothetical protein